MIWDNDLSQKAAIEKAVRGREDFRLHILKPETGDTIRKAMGLKRDKHGSARKIQQEARKAAANRFAGNVAKRKAAR